VMVVVQRPQPMVVVADILVVGNTDHSLLFVHIAGTVDNIGFVELVDELDVAGQLVEVVVAAAVAGAPDVRVEELELGVPLAADSCMHCSYIVVDHANYLIGDSILVEQRELAKDLMAEEQVWV
jgi:hypothetical protein